MRTGSSRFKLLDLARQALEAVGPEAWARDPGPGTAILCWGKAGLRTAALLAERSARSSGAGLRGSGGPAVKTPSLVIAPQAPDRASTDAARGSLARDPSRAWTVVEGGHPLPGQGSFEAGRALIEFMDTLRRFEIDRLVVYLSGGASSLAWLRLPWMREEELLPRLEELYGKPLAIAALNAERARLCQLKGGGAARWLRALSPRTSVEVRVLSDVLPFGPEVVGSGPFWDGRVPHRVLADNATWVRAIQAQSQRAGIRILDARVGRLGPWQDWVRELEGRIDAALSKGLDGLLILGGEPRVDLRARRRGAKPGRGGRQTQIAATLLHRRAGDIARGRVEILCLSSDGVDGASDAAGAWLDPRVGARALKEPGRLRGAIERMDTATILEAWDGLVPMAPTGTNVQDAVVVRVGL